MTSTTSTTSTSTSTSSISSTTAAVVIEMGTRFTRVGFAGEPTCRFVVESSSLSSDIERLLQHIVFKLLHVTPAERTFVVVLHCCATRATRQTIASVLLRRLAAASLAFVRAELAVALALRRRSALLVDSGHAETRLVPVVERVVLETQLRTSPAASLRANLLLVDALRAALPDADPRLVASAAEHARLSNVHLAAVDARTDESVLVRVGATLTATLPRALVNSAALDVLGTDDDDRPLAALVVDALLGSPIDARAILAHNVCVVGGGACAQGYAAALQRAVERELLRRESADATALSTHLRVSSHVKMPASLVCWIGTSLLAAAGDLSAEFLTKDQFEQLDGRWPDAQSIAPPVPLPPVTVALPRTTAAASTATTTTAQMT
jgi:actin-related protein